MLSRKSGASRGHATIGKVVGLLGAALYNPLSTSAVKMPTDFAIAPVGFALPTLWRAPPFVVVAVDGLGGIALAHGMSSDGAALHGVVR